MLAQQQRRSQGHIVAARREFVIQGYNAARADNHLRYLQGDDRATEEYIFPNQIEDAAAIVDVFYKDNCRVVSVQKKTKVGADGLTIEVVKQMTTHPDDDFVVDPANVRVITGMNNLTWQNEAKEKAPNYLKDKIYHHGQLSKAGLKDLRNGVIIIDEIDAGSSEFLVLHSLLKEAGILDVEHMEEHNNRFIFISATMIGELHSLYQWGNLHKQYRMTIPPSYIGHKDFLQMGILREFYPLNTDENADRCVQEDILDYYDKDYRVHLVRVTNKTVPKVQNACIRKGVDFRNHTSTDRLTEEEIYELFKKPLTNHIVLAVKGFFRRANLIPNSWKRRIGATHELYTKKVDYNVQVQGFPGRMTGFWRGDIEGGHKTGPHRTSLRAIEEYEKAYESPFDPDVSYQTSSFKKTNGTVVKAGRSMLQPKHIKNLIPVDLPKAEEETYQYRIYDNEDTIRKVCKYLRYPGFYKKNENEHGFKEISIKGKKRVVSLDYAIQNVPLAINYNKRKYFRTYYPCYVDTTDKSTLRFVLIIRPGTEAQELQECDAKYKPLQE